MTAESSMVGATKVAVLLAAGTLIVGCSTMHGQPHLGGYVDDASISARIKSEMAADKNVDLASITVETTSGTVLLSGFARGPVEKQTAESIAVKIKGVSQVKNEIALRP